jgi:putative membrane-bound dehydrogenase-like protein
MHTKNCSLPSLFAGLMIAGIFCLPAVAAPPSEVPPQLEFLSPGVRLTKVAEHPAVVTPTGIDIDDGGTIWVVASHTHFRPDDYAGPKHDEIIKLGPDGSRQVFYNATDATMDLELGPDGWVYLAERDRVLRVRDTDGDGVGDEEQDIAVLETEAVYPHNGLSGMAWHPSGDLILALGENFFKQWTLTAPIDGSTVTGSGEGGIFRCRPDGSSLRRIARGFWNPFGICVRSDGTMFAGENDPGARPPCRLLHIVEGGDYGYQRRYGNAPVHPFVCWNGELPGTLPMLHSVGEAPCGIAPLGNGLLVTSWTDHRIDFYPLTAAGASFETHRVSLIRGGDFFRPTCIVQQSPTVFYLTDWVFGSYQLHGRGRVWKLEIDPDQADWLGSMELEPANEQAKQAEMLRSGDAKFSDDQLLKLAQSADPFIGRAAIDGLARRAEQISLADLDKLTVRNRVTLLLALRKADPTNETWARAFLHNENSDVVIEALRWIADEQLVSFLPDVRRILDEAQADYRLFEAGLACSNALSGNPSAGVVDPGMLITRIKDANSSAATRAFALRLIDPDDKQFSVQVWHDLRSTGDPRVIRELTRTLALSQRAEAQQMLSAIAQDSAIDVATRADAIAGLAPTETSIPILLTFAQSPERSVREEALRSLRSGQLNEQQIGRLQAVATAHPPAADLVNAVVDAESIRRRRPPATDVAAWADRLSAITQPIDHEAGRRIFFHRSVGACSKCHRHSGRGSVVGPDLSAASNSGDPHRLLVALLQPSKNVDPQYYARTLVTEDGDVFTGIMLRDGGGGKEVYRDNVGRERVFATKEIVTRKELKTSVMPEGLIDLLTDREIRDLLAFLDHHAESSTRVSSDRAASRFIGQWWLDFADDYGGWLSVGRDDDGALTADLLWRVGSARPMAGVSLKGNELRFSRGGKRGGQYVARIDGDEISVTQVGDDQEVTARGRRSPPLPPRPDLAKIKFSPEIELFNGRDLSGWKLQPADAGNGWSVKAGQLINETPKTDFSAYGDYGNLRSEQVFGDCRLHIEFNVDSKCNSGIYVRGLYEAQVVDRDSPMQGINGPGAIFGRIKPVKNAGLPGGQWQTYDITLVDRHITVLLNGQLVIDNQPILGCTGGALFGDVTRQGPVYLQGDHTSVRYRNIRIAPRVN